MSLSIGGAALLGGISALGSVGASAINAAYSGSNLKRQYKYRTKEIDFSNEQSKKLTEWNNLNSAQQQVQGMRLAGLNPAAVNGVSNMVSSSGSSGNYQAAPLGLNLDGVATSAATGAQLSSQNANVESATDKNQADALKAAAEAKHQELENAKEEDLQNAYRNSTEHLVEYNGKLYDANAPEIADVDPSQLTVVAKHSGHRSLEAATTNENIQRVKAAQFKESNEAAASSNALSLSNQQLRLLELDETLKNENINQIHFANVVSEAQVNNPIVFKAMVNLPWAEFNKVRATICDLYASATLKGEQAKMERVLRVYNQALLTPEYAATQREKLYREADKLLDGSLSTLVGAEERGTISDDQSDQSRTMIYVDKGLDMLGGVVDAFAQVKGTKVAKMNAKTNAKNAETAAKRAADSSKPKHVERTNFDRHGNVTNSSRTDSW
jgi:hypothetical protein